MKKTKSDKIKENIFLVFSLFLCCILGRIILYTGVLGLAGFIPSLFSSGVKTVEYDIKLLSDGDVLVHETWNANSLFEVSEFEKDMDIENAYQEGFEPISFKVDGNECIQGNQDGYGYNLFRTVDAEEDREAYDDNDGVYISEGDRITRVAKFIWYKPSSKGKTQYEATYKIKRAIHSVDGEYARSVINITSDTNHFNNGKIKVHVSAEDGKLIGKANALGYNSKSYKKELNLKYKKGFTSRDLVIVGDLKDFKTYGKSEHDSKILGILGFIFKIIMSLVIMVGYMFIGLPVFLIIAHLLDKMTIGNMKLNLKERIKILRSK